jgi:FixJ family two-component response regulator
MMGGMTGIDLLKKVKQINSDTQVIIMTSNASLDTAIEALRAGAYDYLFKSFDDINIISVVTKRAVDKINLILENKRLMEGMKQKNEELEKINEELEGIVSRAGGQTTAGEADPSESKAPVSKPNTTTIQATTIHQKIELIRKESEKVKTEMESLLKNMK